MFVQSFKFVEIYIKTFFMFCFFSITNQNKHFSCKLHGNKSLQQMLANTDFEWFVQNNKTISV